MVDNCVTCPACQSFLLDENDDWDGDGFATCVCGASVDLDAARERARHDSITQIDSGQC